MAFASNDLAPAAAASTRFEYRDGFDISGAVVVAPSERATLAVVAVRGFLTTVFLGPFVGGGYDETKDFFSPFGKLHRTKTISRRTRAHTRTHDDTIKICST